MLRSGLQSSHRSVVLITGEKAEHMGTDEGRQENVMVKAGEEVPF